MKQLISLSTIIFSLLCIGTGSAYCDDTDHLPYMSNDGGTYKLMSSRSDINDRNIVILASHTPDATSDSVRIMTKKSTSHPAIKNSTNRFYFGYYTHGKYGSAMPDTMQLPVVNKAIKDGTDEPCYPSEYIMNIYTATNKSDVYSLQTWKGSYVSHGSASNSLDLAKLSGSSLPTELKWQISQNFYLLDNENYSLSEYYYKGDASDKDNYYFTNYNGTWTNPSTPCSIYKKVHALSIGSTGYATLFYGYNDLILPNGLTAYTYSYDSDKNALAISNTLNAGETIPAGTGVVVKGTPNTTYYLDIIAYQSGKLSNNVLLGSNTDSTATSQDYKYFMLTKTTKGLGFYYQYSTGGTSIKNGAHKAYLRLPASAAAKEGQTLEFLLPSDDTTAINTVPATDKEIPTPCSDNNCYDLSGRRIKEPQQGTYIKQGKKYTR